MNDPRKDPIIIKTITTWYSGPIIDSMLESMSKEQLIEECRKLNKQVLTVARQLGYCKYDYIVLMEAHSCLLAKCSTAKTTGPGLITRVMRKLKSVWS